MASGNAAFKVRRRFARPPVELVQRLTQAQTGNVCDAQGRVGAIDYHIRPLTSSMRFLGPVVTVDTGPRDNLAAWLALEIIEPGDVLMIYTGGHTGCSVIGDVYVTMAANHEVAAIVTDGLVRDVPGIEATGIPVFAAGVSANSPSKNGPGSVGLSIVLGGVSVTAGDVAIGDCDGVVVVPQGTLESVTCALKNVQAKEQKMEEAVHAGTTSPTWLQETIEQLGVDYLD